MEIMLAGEVAAPAPALLAGKWDHRGEITSCRARSAARRDQQPAFLGKIGF